MRQGLTGPWVGGLSHVFSALNMDNKKAVDVESTAFDCLVLVPRRGLEPPRLAALVPETSASTNSAIWASQEVSNYRAAKDVSCHCLEIVTEFLTMKNLGNKKADDLWSSAFCHLIWIRLVPRRGLEPPRLSALVPETSASTNSAIWASQESKDCILKK